MRGHTLEGRALAFAFDAHGDQVRKYTGEPYIVHLIEVHALVKRCYPQAHTLGAIALLHDTIEDTRETLDPVTLQDIYDEFGSDVADGVGWLTDVPSSYGNRVARKQADRDRIARAPIGLKSIKLADLISNTRSIAQHDPSFAKVYMAEKQKVLEVLQDGHSELLAQATQLIKDYYLGKLGGIRIGSDKVL